MSRPQVVWLEGEAMGRGRTWVAGLNVFCLPICGFLVCHSQQARGAGCVCVGGGKAPKEAWHAIVL